MRRPSDDISLGGGGGGSIQVKSRATHRQNVAKMMHHRHRQLEPLLSSNG